MHLLRRSYSLISASITLIFVVWEYYVYLPAVTTLPCLQKHIQSVSARLPVNTVVDSVDLECRADGAVVGDAGARVVNQDVLNFVVASG